MEESGAKTAMHGLRILGGTLLFTALLHAQAPPPPSIAVEDCSKLKGKSKTACETRVEASRQGTSGTPEKSQDKFPFPEEQSKGTEAQRKPSASDMPTTGVADPPAESMRPLRPDGTPDDAPAGAATGSSSPGSSSSSTSSPSSSSAAPEDDDVAPTRAGGDSPVKPSSLKDLGSHGDVSAARAKLEQTRVADDLRVGHFYLQDGNYAGAVARYKDALDRDADNADAHFGYAEVLARQGKREEAMGHLNRYLALAPDEDHSNDARKMLAKLGRAK